MSDGPNDVSRRRFLSSGAAVLGLALLPGPLVRWLGDGPKGPGAGAVERLVGLFEDPGEVASIGRRYLEGREHALGREELLAEVLPPDVDAAEVAEASDDQLRASLSGWMKRDLSAGRIEEVDGWLLSRTEVRLAALTVL